MSIESVVLSNQCIFCLRLLLLPSIFPSIRVFFNESAFHRVAKVLFQLQHQSFQWILRTNFLYDWLVWSPCNTRDSQESSPAPQFKSISSLALLTKWCLCFFNTLFRFVIAFLPRNGVFYFIFFKVYLFFLFVVNFVIHWNETAMGLHVFPIPIPPPTSLSTRSL